MMSIKQIVTSNILLLSLAMVTGCNQVNTADTDTPAAPTSNKAPEMAAQQYNPPPPAPKTGYGLPVRYQSPSYMVGTEEQQELIKEETTALKVGASIRSTRGPQPLWDILKRLAALKKMNVSWASDVNLNVLVDVDISANDDFYDSIDNLLRQVDYFHEMEGKTIVVKYKETRKYHIAMPFTKQDLTTSTGGNVLGSDDSGGNIDGTIEMKSTGNSFDTWKNIKANMDAIINTWNTRTSTPKQAKAQQAKSAEGSGSNTVATRQISSGNSMYIIDKPIGMITVTAPRPLLSRLEVYFDSLKEELYKQINIEAKIIEVILEDSSSIGIDWSNVLKDFPIDGQINFGAGGMIYPSGGSEFISSITLTSSDFGAFLSLLDEQGDTNVLSNPKISVMNGQPALITVGRNVTYVDNIKTSTKDLEGGGERTEFTATTDQILSGIGMALTATILNDEEIIMNLVPVTSELLEPIEDVFIGNDGAFVGLPVVNVREMNTTVRVKDGEMLVIGGLISNVDETTSKFAPGVGNIPLLRYLFGQEEKISRKRELIILLRPRII